MSRRGAAWLTGGALATMTAALTWAFTVGDFWREGAVLLAMPWGIVSIIDVYVGGALFAGWIAARERSWWRTGAWVAAFVIGGNLVSALYAVLALRASGGDRQRFWLGDR